MLRIFNQKRLFDLKVGIPLIALMVLIIKYPTESVTAAKNGISLCGNVIIPSLFPFFVLSSILVDLGLAKYPQRLLNKLMYPLFHVSGIGATPLILGFLGGYPVGAKTTVSLYERGLCTKEEAERLLGFSNNSGPAFILGVVGAGIFASAQIGGILYISHIIAAITVGIIFRTYASDHNIVKKRASENINSSSVQFTEVFTESVKNSFFSTLTICAYVIFFTVVINLFKLTGIISFAANAIAFLTLPFGITAEWIESIFTGLIEVSSGVYSLTELEGHLTLKICMAAFMLGWAGLSVHCQTISFISKSGLKITPYIFGKLMHSIFSAVYAFIITTLIQSEFRFTNLLQNPILLIAIIFISTVILLHLKKGRKENKNAL